METSLSGCRQHWLTCYQTIHA